MDAGKYTNCGEEVPLGVECALPHGVGSSLQDGRLVPEQAFASSTIEAFGTGRLMLSEPGPVHND